MLEINSQTAHKLDDYRIELPQTDKLHVLRIQRTCVHDGPGIRTTVFFRGCALRCLWCQNPEALSFTPDPESDGNYSVDGIMEEVLRDREYYVSTSGGVTLSGGDPLLQDSDSLICLLEKLRAEQIHVAAETYLVTEFPPKFHHIQTGFGFQGIIGIQAHFDKVGKNSLHISAAVIDHRKIAGVADLNHLLDNRLKMFTPELR